MRKKRVISVFSILILLGLGLGLFNFYSFGSFTGKVIDHSYSQELFIGDAYEFKFYPSKIDFSDGALHIAGTLRELSGNKQALQVTGYVFDANGDSIGSYSNELFLDSGKELIVRFDIPLLQGDPGQAIIYFEDETSSVRIHKQFSIESRSISGSVVSEREGKEESSGLSFFFGVLLLVGVVLFVVYRIRQNNSQTNLDDLFSKRESRKYIDLDIR